MVVGYDGTHGISYFALFLAVCDVRPSHSPIPLSPAVLTLNTIDNEKFFVLSTYAQPTLMLIHRIVRQEQCCRRQRKPRNAAVNFVRYGVCRQLFFFDTFRGVDMINA